MFFSSFSIPGKHPISLSKHINSSTLLVFQEIWGRSLLKYLKASQSCLECLQNVRQKGQGSLSQTRVPKTQGTSTPAPQHILKVFTTNWMWKAWTSLWELMITSPSFPSSRPTPGYTLPMGLTCAPTRFPSPVLFTMQLRKAQMHTAVREALTSSQKQPMWATVKTWDGKGIYHLHFSQET